MPRPLLPRLLAAATPTGEQSSDADLLRRFVREADTAAFELVVRRHAPAVWTACRRILPEADAEDAFQAAFLVLARKAAAVRGASAGGWLHRVAVTAALKRKAAGRRGPAFGVPAAEPADPAPAPVEALSQAELAAAVHEELARLPDRYRLPVVLCDLEGETQPAAASRLGWPVGSVAGRLSRARALLRDRLARRGYAPVGAVLVLPAAAVPGHVVTAAVAAATGAVPPPVPVSLLATGVLSAMRIAKLKVFSVVLVSAGVVGAAGFGAYTAAAQPAPAPGGAQKAEPPLPGPIPPGPGGKAGPKWPPASAFPEIVTPPRHKGEDVPVPADPGAAFPALFSETALRVEAGEDRYRQIRKAQLDQARQVIVRLRLRMAIGQFQTTEIYENLWLYDDVAVTAAEVWANNPRTLDAWLVDLVRLAKEAEEFAAARVEVGVDQPHMINLTSYHRLRLEAMLWKHRNPGKAP
ncbi:MAG TPA: sigma-70 family RNA polymerase sigma factor [Urbifossiella sp.]|jgi:RNA polymerase sigma factor (sigma-70 family)|nr:sigma-70 family RNA polymerase sigma factor [Urbifossiella sp.]